jgi:3-oxoadipate enol-lactonase
LEAVTTNDTRASNAPSMITVRDGVRIAYRLHGPLDSENRILLVHSLAMDGTFWHRVIDLLDKDAAILAIDCRGHGMSDKPIGPYTVEQFAQDAHEVCRAIGFDRVLVAGASMGGCVALQFAASFPESTRALGLIDTTAWYGPTAPEDWRNRANNAIANGLPALIEFQTTRWFSDAFREANPDVLAKSIEIFLRNDSAQFAAACMMLGIYDGRSQLGKINVATSVVVGEEDYAAPVAMAEALHEGIPGSTLLVIPQARHLTPLETPQIVADELKRLLDITNEN